MKEWLNNATWALGVRLRNSAKRAGLLGHLEPVILTMAQKLIPPPQREVEVTLPLGIRMVVPPGYPAARSFAAGCYEEDVTQLFESIVKEGMTVIDLGANIGYYTLLASRLVGIGGRVYAFEPDARTYEYLCRNIQANDCRNVIMINKAASDKTGAAFLIRDTRSDEKNWLSSRPPSDVSIIVHTVTLDEFFEREGWPSIDLVKIDIEGSENAALNGMQVLCRRNPLMQIVMEWDVSYIKRSGGTVEELASTLRKAGFIKAYVIEWGLKPVSLAGELPRTAGYYNLLVRQGIQEHSVPPKGA